MSSLILSYLDDEHPEPVVYSTPPRIDSDGDEQPAQITIQPWGPAPLARDFDPDNPPPIPNPEKARITMYFSLEEAEALARKLVEVVVAAKDGIYSAEGEELVRYIREKDLNDAWTALGLNDDEHD
ncbi:hypothetical protein [Mycolicibacterium sp.]|uniref:hypothetical protein n=1 Tax=Mycolicibacterium sp. TaxID=2320850 RepID=UPI0037C64527